MLITSSVHTPYTQIYKNAVNLILCVKLNAVFQLELITVRLLKPGPPRL